MCKSQRAVCDAYGVVVNVVTSDQLNWCAEKPWKSAACQAARFESVFTIACIVVQVHALPASNNPARKRALPHLHLPCALQHHQVRLPSSYCPPHLALVHFMIHISMASCRELTTKVDEGRWVPALTMPEHVSCL